MTGYRASRGEYLLFTDADVFFAPACLEKAVILCEREGVDHLVATPGLLTEGFWERVFVPFFLIVLESRFRIWRASNPRSRFYAGIGAFNLIRRTAYERAGTHEALKGEAVDDLLLGRLVKRSGGRPKVVSGEGCLTVRWNIGLGGLVEGLEKNAFAGFDYSLLRAAAGCMILLTATLLPGFMPFIGIMADGGRVADWAAVAGFGVCGVFAFLYHFTSRLTGASWLYFITFPVGAILMVWTIVRSAVLYHVRGGIKWRGTTYKSEG
jgi:hypothetical protein